MECEVWRVKAESDESKDTVSKRVVYHVEFGCGNGQHEFSGGDPDVLNLSLEKWNHLYLGDKFKCTATVSWVYKFPGIRDCKALLDEKEDLLPQDGGRSNG